MTRFVWLLLALWSLSCSTASETENGTDTADSDVLADTVSATDSVSIDTTDTIDGTGVPAVMNQFPWAGESVDETCSNGVDDDDNGYADCDDFGCARNLAVFVCGAKASFENSPTDCANGQDDDGDGRVDCDDPDCARNPFHDVCPPIVHETVCDDGKDNDQDGFTDCDDFDCKLLAQSCTDAPRVLFDQTLDETGSGSPNADWIMDAWGRLPFPSNPTKSGDWVGSLSTFGFQLHQAGYLVENLPSWNGKITWEDTDNPQDLTHYDVVILFEPSRQIDPIEQGALLHFVLAGGGLLMVGNHQGADRDGNGWTASGAFNDLMTNNNVQADPFGFAFDQADIDTGAPITSIPDPSSPLVDGPFGTVNAIGFYDGDSAHLTGTNPDAIGVLFHDNAADDASNIVVGLSQAGEGRVVFVTDSAIGGDGTDSHGEALQYKDSWDNANQNNDSLFLNAVAFLAGKSN